MLAVAEDEGPLDGTAATLRRDVDCTLALLLGQRFTVLDHLPVHKARKADPADQNSSIVSSVVVIGLGVAATAGLIYGVATCELEGCRAGFGVPRADRRRRAVLARPRLNATYPDPGRTA